MKRKTDIIILQQHAINKCGRLISTEYINAHSNLLWECDKLHQWETPWNNIKYKNSWCPFCAFERNSTKKQIDISELHEYAKRKGGKLISTEYVNARSHLLWECEQGHQWESDYGNLKYRDAWCPMCSDVKLSLLYRGDIKDLQEYALSKEGRLITENYINNSTNVIWECKEKHQWEARWNNVKFYNQWCPECASFKTEKLCKQLLEQKLNIEFKKTRFYEVDQRFEWDGYNAERKIAFEYHGYQHYEYPNRYYKTKEDFIQQLERDESKVRYAKENNIILLIIPYTESDNLEEYINELISRSNYVK
jgi:thiol-disulfide isomerase/thioredoxin